MGRRWSLALVGAILLGAVFLAPIVRADPAISRAAADEGVAEWRFSNPANYSASDLDLGPAGASLAWLSLSHRDTTRSDFSLASSLANIDLVRTPGRVLLADTSQGGPVQNITFQPDPASMADNFLYAGNSNQNYGNAAQLFVGNWSNGTWTRSFLQFPALPLPVNATIVSAQLELYYNFVIDATPMDISVHAVTSNWTEFGSTWNSADGIAPWNAAGGDFDPTAVATVAGITNGTGWYGWNVTSLVVGWWTSAVPELRGSEHHSMAETPARVHHPELPRPAFVRADRGRRPRAMDRPLVERDRPLRRECDASLPHRRLGPPRRHLECMECAAPDLRDADLRPADALPPISPRPLHPVRHLAERAGRHRDVYEICPHRLR